ISLGGFSASLVTTHGTGGAAVTIEGSGFPALTSFSNGGTVFFPNGSGNQAVSVTYGGSSSPDSSRLTVPAPNGGYSGQVEVCINGNTAGVLTSGLNPKFSYVPRVTSVPASATEGSTSRLGGDFLTGQGAEVHFSCGTAGGSVDSLTQLTVTVPGYCPGPISVTQT